MLTLAGLTREGLAMLIAPQLSLGANEANSWPPPGDIVLKAPKIVIIGQRLCAAQEAGGDAGDSSGILIDGHR
jgi:hypothetical protein